MFSMAKKLNGLVRLGSPDTPITARFLATAEFDFTAILQCLHVSLDRRNALAEKPRKICRASPGILRDDFAQCFYPIIYSITIFGI